MIVRSRSALSVTALAVAALAMVTLAMVTLAGCGGASPPSGAAAASAARGQVLPAARGLYQRIYDAHIGWASGFSGQYEHCLTSNSQNELDYHGIISYLYPVNRSITATAYRQEVMNTARSDGWTFKKFIKGSRDGNLFPYQMEKGSLNGHISLVSAPAGSRSYKFSTLIEIESSCFDAGSAAKSLSQHSSQYSLPHPSPLPAG
jgi:hypothetical protein